MADNESMSGLTPDEAREFHKFYIQGMALFVGVALVAHLLVWIWRPWFHDQPASFASDVLPLANTLTSLIG